MMLTLSPHLESVLENKPVHNPEAASAYLAQLATTNSLSKELESITNQLEEKFRLSRRLLLMLSKTFTKSRKYDDLMAECFLREYEAFRYQASSLHPETEWSSLEPDSDSEQKPRLAI
ncbi:hypothetical protein PanWU01x14_091860 [Parasponia andersonii]|uniref:Uncharacterized protein n=1 Tax=Parasponia andersonii TaxID=3476 RepID=A0A2P5D6D5_PARAD|nr:hypothetical protein PanWU01x14_091860 [Parasponia andersonii]